MTEPCCQLFHEAELYAIDLVTVSRARRLTIPSTMDEADWLDVCSFHRQMSDLRAEHHKFHHKEERVNTELLRLQNEAAEHERRLTNAKAKLYSQALDEAMALIAARSEPVVIRDDPKRVPARVIANVIYDWFKAKGEWPTPTEAAGAVANEVCVTTRAAVQAIEYHYSSTFAAAQTLVLSGPKYGEATPQSEADVWRLIINDRDWPKHERQWQAQSDSREYDALVQRWVDELTQEMPGLWKETP